MHETIDEGVAVDFSKAVLAVSPTVLTAANGHGATPGDMALLCENRYAIQRIFTTVLFESYQLLKPSQPAIYKSETAVLYECRVVQLSKDTSSTLCNTGPLQHRSPSALQCRQH